jgi:hypothetical protein
MPIRTTVLLLLLGAAVGATGGYLLPRSGGAESKVRWGEGPAIEDLESVFKAHRQERRRLTKTLLAELAATHDVKKRGRAIDLLGDLGVPEAEVAAIENLALTVPASPTGTFYPSVGIAVGSGLSGLVRVAELAKREGISPDLAMTVSLASTHVAEKKLALAVLDAYMTDLEPGEQRRVAVLRSAIAERRR